MRLARAAWMLLTLPVAMFAAAVCLAYVICCVAYAAFFDREA